MNASEKIQQNRDHILRVLSASGSRLHSGEISSLLQARTIHLNARTIRLYLAEMQKEGLVDASGRKGCLITEAGEKQIKAKKITEHIGYMSAHIDRLTWLMDYSFQYPQGNVVVNLSIIPLEVMQSHISAFLEVFRQGYAMGELIGFLKEEEIYQGMEIPKNHIGILTVCSITLNRILLNEGIPVRSLFSGLLELENKQPRAISELISYSATSINPLQLFIQAGMSDYLGAITTGTGRIGIGFREAPAESYEHLKKLQTLSKKKHMGAFMEIGPPNAPLYNVPVSPGYCGIIVVGGLNPAAVFYEKGEKIFSKATAGLYPAKDLFHYSELRNLLETK